VWAKVPPDLQKLFVDEANAMWQESLETWKHGAAEKKAYDFLATKGMKLLAPMPVADQKLIQAELLKIWRQQSEKISPAALGYFERINKALNSGK